MMIPKPVGELTEQEKLWVNVASQGMHESDHHDFALGRIHPEFVTLMKQKGESDEAIARVSLIIARSYIMVN